MNNLKAIFAIFLCLGFINQSLAEQMSLACVGDKTFSENDPVDLTFALGETLQGSQVSPNGKSLELILSPDQRSQAKVKDSTISIEAAFNPVDGNYDVDVYDSKISVPGDARPRIMRVGGSSEGADSTSSIRFEYEQWGPVPTSVEEKRLATVYSFKCTVAKFPQLKF